MKTQFFRACAVALTIAGTAAVAAVAFYPQEAAAAVRAAVGKPLQEAISLAGSGNGSAALAKVHEAEAVPGLTAAEHQKISETKEYIAAKTGQGGGANACKAKFANDYNGGRYRDAINDADCLHKTGSFSGQDQLIVAQAYYLLGDCAGAIREARSVGGATANELMLAAAHKCGDTATERTLLEQLVRDGKPQYWTNLLQAAENSHGLKDHETLDIYRLRSATNTLRNAEDYTLAAELALQVGSSQEAANLVQKGIDAKILTGDRTARLLALARTTAQKDSANFAAAQKAADASPTGDADLKLSEEYYGFGKGAEAVSAAQNAIKKGVADKGNAQMRLGQAYMAAGQRSDAVSAFNKVSRDDANQQMVAHLWALYAASGR